jgi:outer membrane protein assembly factor BamE (lipoprotein component of BamABCDE complex)
MVAKAEAGSVPCRTTWRSMGREAHDATRPASSPTVGAQLGRGFHRVVRVGARAGRRGSSLRMAAGKAGVIALCLSGCISVGRPFEQSSVEKLQKGETTRAQVLALFGSPDQVTRDSSGTESFYYYFCKTTPSAATFVPVVGAFAGGGTIQQQSLTVVLAAGIVQDFTSMQSASETGYGATAGGSATVPEVEQGKRPQTQASAVHVDMAPVLP